MGHVRANIRVEGAVQGVGFRYFAYREANRLGLTGHARNLPDGGVSVTAQGEAEKVEAFVDRLRAGPPAATVRSVRVHYTDPEPWEKTFSIA
jgi:acylphosphatase